LSIVANNIKFSRRLKRITQSQLAEALGVTRGSIANWESGVSNAPVDIVMKVAKIIGASVEEFYHQDFKELGWHLGLHNTGNSIQVTDDSIQVTAPNEVQEPPGSYTAKEEELSALRLRIKRLELFISQKFPDFPLDQL
jgi:transcriptional regulator with XRE-family HTH domain